MTEADRARLMALPPAQAAGLTAYLESRSQPVLGIVGVICTIKHRAALKAWNAPDDAHRWQAAAFAPWQYSCWNTHDVNCILGLNLAETFLAGRQVPQLADRIILETAIWLAERVLAGEVDDPVDGSTHYYADSLLHRPAWAAAPARLTAHIGAHRFYADVAL
jgi:N-acetylmuramoyl-L-alanine amidase